MTDWISTAIEDIEVANHIPAYMRAWNNILLAAKRMAARGGP
jgi:hypothetical protein